MSVRILGIDPGLTRCGVGVVEIAQDRTARLVAVTVIRTPPDLALEQRLLAVGNGIDDLLDQWTPDAVALERVFAQHNLRTVMGTAQVSGVALHAAARRGLTVGLHTPSEVKAAITGYGSAEKQQVGAMVARVLGLAEVPKPADAADALAIAICHGWKRQTAPTAGAGVGVGAPTGGALTPAQQIWLAAERAGQRR